MGSPEASVHHRGISTGGRHASETRSLKAPGSSSILAMYSSVSARACTMGRTSALSTMLMTEALVRRAPIIPADMFAVYRLVWNGTVPRPSVAPAVAADMPVAAG